jgi:DNA polymerase, archaea type
MIWRKWLKGLTSMIEWRLFVKISFWLLDINPKIDSDKGTVELWLWGIDTVGNRVLVVDHTFVAYFYVVLADGFEGSKVAEAIMNTYSSSIVKTEVVERRFFGKPVTAIKVSCKVATETSKLAKQLRSIEGVKDCLEEDIRASMRYLIDNNVVPCSWHEADANEEENTEDVRVSKIYSVKAPLKHLDKVVVPELRVLSFSMICYSREGSPKPDRNPVIIISTSTSNGETKQFIASENKNDKLIIEEFIAYIYKFDPDIIANYSANSVDWTYLKGRSHKLKLKLNFDRAHMEPHTSVYGHVSTIGTVNLNLADFMDVFPEVKVKTLWNFANHLSILSDEQRLIEDVEFADYWDDKKKRGELMRFGLESACKVQGTAELLLDFAIQLASLTSLPLDQVMTAAVGFRVEWFLIKQGKKIGELVPKRIEQHYIPYAGGLVLSPKPGLHENIAVLDFKSMYPNIMITYNLSPDTYIAPNEPIPTSGVYTAPEVGHKFRKVPPGFYKEALTYLINIRGTIRQKMKTMDPKTVQYHVLDARQKAVKIITNAAYGYAGWIGAKWYIKPVAEAASAWGRHIILTASQMAEKAGIQVVYGDTDSLFLYYDKAKIPKLEEEIKRELKLEVEIGEVYSRLFFTEAKKRYAGLRQDGSLDIVGLEVIRGDWAEVAKEMQEQILEIILKEQSPKKAVDFVRSVIADLKNRKVQLNELIIWKTLTKSPEDYANKAPHVEAAKMLKDKGWRLTTGDKVGYVILEGKGRLYSRVKPYVFAKIEEVDADYYITNQVLPAALRILSFFEITEAELLKETKEKEEIKSLMDYV